MSIFPSPWDFEWRDVAGRGNTFIRRYLIMWYQMASRKPWKGGNKMASRWNLPLCL